MLKVINTKEVLDGKFLPPYDGNEQPNLYQRGWNDAIDAVLDRAYKAPKSALEWIPFHAWMPEPYTNVLMYIERDAWVDGHDNPIRKKEVAIGNVSPDGSCYVDGCSGVVPIAWMPLPEAPGPCEYKDGDKTWQKRCGSCIGSGSRKANTW